MFFSSSNFNLRGKGQFVISFCGEIEGREKDAKYGVVDCRLINP